MNFLHYISFSSDWKTKGSVWGNISLFMAVWTHSRGRGLCLGVCYHKLIYFTIKNRMYNVHVTLIGYMGCLMMYMDDIEWREFPYCCSQIPERALTKYSVDPIIVSAQIWFEMNIEFVWSNSKMFVLLVWNILPCRQLTRQYATKGRPRIRQTLANMQTFDQN